IINLPPRPEPYGSATPTHIDAVTAASITLPPSANTARAARVASGCPVTTTNFSATADCCAAAGSDAERIVATTKSPVVHLAIRPIVRMICPRRGFPCTGKPRGFAVPIRQLNPQLARPTALRGHEATAEGQQQEARGFGDNGCQIRAVDQDI